MRKPLVAITFLGIYLISPVSAYAKTVIGAKLDCEAWLAEKKEAQRDERYGWVGLASTKSWLMGYLSGLNVSPVWERDLLQAVDGQLVEEWVTKWCERNPSGRIDEAAIDLLQEINQATKKVKRN